MLLFCFIATVRLEYENFGIKFYSPVGIFSSYGVYGCGAVNELEQRRTTLRARTHHTHKCISIGAHSAIISIWLVSSFSQQEKRFLAVFEFVSSCLALDACNQRRTMF